MRRPILLVAVLCACEAQVDIAAPRPAPGEVSVLQSGGDRGRTGWWPSLTFDANDQPHLSYCDAHNADLMYATRVGAEWQITTVVGEGNVGKYTALGVDGLGRPGIAFYDQDKKYLRYAWQRADGTWKDERVAWGLDVGMGGELRFDEQNEPHLFYYIPSGKLIHAHKSGGQWIKRTVAPATGGFSVRISPVLRPDGFWISFVDWRFKDTALQLARPAAEGFDLELIDDRRGPGWRSQLLFENGAPVIIFSQSFSEDLRIAERDGASWRFLRLVRQAGNFAATRTAAGDVVVAYEDVTGASAGAGVLKLLRRSEGNWQSYDIDSDGPAGSYLALATDSQGRALVAYYAGKIRGIRVYDESR